MNKLLPVTGAKIIQHKDSTETYDIPVEDGQIIQVGKIMIRIVHTPGHSKDSMSLVVNNELVLTGDTLFVGNWAELTCLEVMHRRCMTAYSKR